LKTAVYTQELTVVTDLYVLLFKIISLVFLYNLATKLTGFWCRLWLL